LWTCPQAELPWRLRDWRDEVAFDAAAWERMRIELLAGVLAARHNRAVDPDGYVRTCLRQGVRGFWRAKAEQLAREFNHRRQESETATCPGRAGWED
jgi:hypothetical protein